MDGRGPEQVEDGVGVALPEIDVARVRRWVAAQNERIGEHIDEMRVEMDVGSGDHDPRVPAAVARGLRSGLDPTGGRPTSLHEHFAGVDVVLTRPQQQVPPLRGPVAGIDRRSASRRGRRRPDLHLLGLTLRPVAPH
jgi:hypothetical protein